MKHSGARVPSLPEILLSLTPIHSHASLHELTNPGAAAALNNSLHGPLLPADTWTSKTQGWNNNEVRSTGLSALHAALCLQPGKKNSLCIYSFNYFRSQLPPEAGLGKRATRASHFAFISQQFSSWSWLSSKAWHKHSTALVCPAAQLRSLSRQVYFG